MRKIPKSPCYKCHGKCGNRGEWKEWFRENWNYICSTLKKAEAQPLVCPFCGNGLVVSSLENAIYKHPANENCLLSRFTIERRNLKMWNRRFQK